MSHSGSRKRLLLWSGAALVLVLLAAGSLMFFRPTTGLGPRRASQLPFPAENPFSGQWETENVFPDVTFDRPLLIVPVPDGSSARSYLVAQQDGLVLNVSRGTPATPFLDLRSRVVAQIEAGFLGLTFHPGFRNGTSSASNYLYIFYVTRENGQLYDRLSRLEWLPTEPRPRIETEQILINELDRHTDHNGGNLVFGPDGFLYVGVGDEGGVGDEFGNAQHLDKNLYSGILRIDVDCRAGLSHPIRRQPQNGATQAYCIPDDNPFVGLPNALEEFWSIGLRNPHRFSFDGHTLIGGDVGQDRRESIFIASRGSNHGWSFREGSEPFLESPLQGRRPPVVHGVDTMPVYEYPHTNGNGAIIAGPIYRGQAFPELQGKLIVGDFDSGRVWALDLQTIVPHVETLLRLPPDQRVVSFGVDYDGELFICVFGKRAGVLRLRRRT